MIGPVVSPGEDQPSKLERSTESECLETMEITRVEDTPKRRLMRLSDFVTERRLSYARGDFVKTSRERWLNRSRDLSDVKLASHRVLSSAACLIQTTWRCHFHYQATRQRLHHIRQRLLSSSIKVLREGTQVLEHQLVFHTKGTLVGVTVNDVFCLVGFYYQISGHVIARWVQFWFLHHIQRRTKYIRFSKAKGIVAPTIGATKMIKKHMVENLQLSSGQHLTFWTQVCTHAVLVLQCAWRRSLARVTTASLRHYQKRAKSATKLQRWVLALRQRQIRRYLTQDIAALTLQCWTRQRLSCAHVRTQCRISAAHQLVMRSILPSALTHVTNIRQTQAATVLQVLYRGHVVRRKLAGVRLDVEIQARKSTLDRVRVYYHTGRIPEATCCAQTLFEHNVENSPEFWTLLAKCHFEMWKANNDPSHLRQVSVAMETYLRLEDSGDSSDELMLLYFLSLYFLNQFQKCRQVLELYRVRIDACYVLQRNAQFKMIKVLLSIEAQEWKDACIELLLIENQFPKALLPFSTYDHSSEPLSDHGSPDLHWQRDYPRQSKLLDLSLLEIRFLLGWIYLQLEDAHLARVWFLKTFQLIELRCGNGFYHGRLSDAKVQRILAKHPPGAFLIHHPSLKKEKLQRKRSELAQSVSPDDVSKSTNTPEAVSVFYLKTRFPDIKTNSSDEQQLSDLNQHGNPPASTSGVNIQTLKIHFNTTTGQYQLYQKKKKATPESAVVSTWTLLGFLRQLPTALQIDLRQGILSSLSMISKTGGRAK